MSITQCTFETASDSSLSAVAQLEAMVQIVIESVIMSSNELALEFGEALVNKLQDLSSQYADFLQLSFSIVKYVVCSTPPYFAIGKKYSNL